MIDNKEKMIGILTLQWGTNYGGTLQNYALATFLKEQGYQVEVINYWPDYALNKRHLKISSDNTLSESAEKQSVKSMIKNRAKKYLGLDQRVKATKISEFQNRHIPLGKEIIQSIRDFNDIKEKYYALIAGSDQIWNPLLTGGSFDPVYFLEFPGYNGLKIAYAASLGISTDKIDDIALCEHVKNFTSVSCREKSLSTFLEEKKVFSNVQTVIDPVFLCEKKTWNSLINDANINQPDYLKEDYLLVYGMERSKELVEAEKMITSKTGLKAIIIGSKNSYKNVLRYESQCEVETFLSLLFNAQVVLTNSFHGTAFSIIFEKQFYTVPHSSKSSRMIDLLAAIGLSERVFDADKCDLSKIDYSLVNSTLQNMISQSAAFLKGTLEEKQKEKNSVKNNLSYCNGCGACVSACKLDAIKIITDEKGFQRAIVDNERCIGCGQCVRSCSMINYKKLLNSESEIYAAKNTSSEERLKSSSGGCFLPFARFVIQQGGAVYGAQYDDTLTVVHGRAVNLVDAEKFCGSKYVNSFLGDTFQKVSEDLNADRKVLFTGTPCQVSGLITYLRINNIPVTNLITCDFVCHGVPSPTVFKLFITYLEDYYNKPIKSYKFRYKPAGWRHANVQVVFENGDTLVNEYHSRIFTQRLFAISMRESCFSCPFARENRCADITLGDFWGIEKSAVANFEDKLGVSMLLINSDKGKNMIEELKDSFDLIRITLNDCKSNKPLVRPTPRPQRRGQFWIDVRNKPFKYIMNKYGFDSGKTSLDKKMKHFIKYKTIKGKKGKELVENK